MDFHRSSDSNCESPTGELRFASSPEGLVAKGDGDAMKRFIQLSGDQSGQDAAREMLMNAATHSLACTKDGRVLRMRLYGWAISLSYGDGVQMPSTIGFSSAGQPQVLLKLRELWSRAFGAKSGTLISPLGAATHMNSVLSVTPILLRDCVRHGVNIVAGKSTSKSWSFDTGGIRIEQASPDIPAAYILGAYVCWDFNAAEPKPELTADVRFEMQQLMMGLFSHAQGVKINVSIGEPSIYHHAITCAQGLQLAGMLRRAHALNQQLTFNCLVEGACNNLTAEYQDVDGEDDPTFTHELSYSNQWRSSCHVAEIHAMVEREVLVINRNARAHRHVHVPISFELDSKIH